MKIKIVILSIILCLISTSAAYARQGYGGHHRDYRGGVHFKSAHHNGAKIAFGLLGGLLLGSALYHKMEQHRRGAQYGTNYNPYQRNYIARQPHACMEERVVNGQWQTSSYDGRRIWVQFPQPVVQRFLVPCG